jgi:hypothetical protein
MKTLRTFGFSAVVLLACIGSLAVKAGNAPTQHSQGTRPVEDLPYP